MNFDELNEETFVLFAIKHYENPHCVTREDFDEDMKRFKYLKRFISSSKSSRVTQWGFS